MIPAFNQSGVLPPYLPGSDPTDCYAVSPYETTMLEVVLRFGTTPIRRKQLSGLLQMRDALRQLGVTGAFQWIDGSFSEDVEATEQRDPGDIDVVTYGILPEAIGNTSAVLQDYPDLFYPQRTKARYCCDAYFVDMSLPAEAVHLATCYWLGLFSHKRVSSLWKGMLRVPLEDDDAAALLALGGAP